MNELDVVIMILVIGIFTYVFRTAFLLRIPKFVDSKSIQEAMEGISPAILVAFVIPTIITASNFSLTSEILAVCFTAILVYLSKKPSIGIILAFGFNFVLEWLGLP